MEIGISLVVFLLLIVIIMIRVHNDESTRAFSTVILAMIIFIIGVLLTQKPLLIGAGIVIFAGHVYINGRKGYTDVKVKKIFIESDNLSENFTAVFIADLQFDKKKHLINEYAFDNIINMVNDVDHDMVLLGGDYLNYKEMLPTYLDKLKKLDRPRYGMYAILGNHDYVCYDEMIKGFEDQGIMCLENKRFDLTDEISISGVEDEWYGDPQLPEMDAVRLNILIAHNPDYIHKIPKDNNVDLMVSGHYHGGQVNLFGVTLQRMISRYDYGFYTDNNMNTFVTSGCGGNMFRGPIGFWIRYNARPEIVEIKFIGNKNKEKSN